MQQVHGFACFGNARSERVPPELARIQRGHATALKPPRKAGRRGGESIARQRWCVSLSAPWWCCRGRRRFVGGWVWLCACGASEA
ncbi:hypothetical protein QE001_000579 [Salmonella enterica]|nr:hypothetical protein [Salmonella enterica]EGK1332383.1 hypothetical protein [Salmonella enterica]EHG2440617.1 hypothetical protein [Salmonella enterica]EHH0569388.1 hypothetical protein [Salmonella enterica]EHZ9075761.1 hypothetical protein [Salmonella enterica]